jgi:hypothetical protein
VDEHDDPFVANLFLLGDREDPRARFLTDWESPLSWPLYGTFQPGVTGRDTITSKVGLEVADFSFDWSPKEAPFTKDIATANPYQLARLHCYDAKPFTMFRTIGPTLGDANTFGACVLFGGRVKNSKVGRGKISFTIESLLTVINQLVPPNVVEVTNTIAGYKGATPVLADGETTIPRFTVAAPSTATNILGVCTAPTPNKIYGDNKFKLGYLVFTSGTLAGMFSAMAGSNAFRPIIPGPFYNQFIVFAPFPWDPAPGDTFYVSTAYPTDGSQSPFLHVPAPETAV